MPYSVASGSGIVDHNSSTDDSIVRAMDKFVQSFSRMEDTIMVPSRLKVIKFFFLKIFQFFQIFQDMPVTVHFHKGTTALPVAGGRQNSIVGANSKSLVISNGKSETKVVDMYNIYEVGLNKFNILKFTY
jgi:hypothetical protein